tara:strand:+ start:373 stop:585 length:213 start_codon:yes stop_codon:yes gene_type:complete
MTYLNIQQQEEADFQDDYISEAYGGEVESKENLDYEAAFYAAIYSMEAQDDMEARGGPKYNFDTTEEIPF